MQARGLLMSLKVITELFKECVSRERAQESEGKSGLELRADGGWQHLTVSRSFSL